MDKSSITDHISSQFNQELAGLFGRVLEMCRLVQEQMRDASRALRNGDLELGRRVAASDFRINALEVQTDEECTRIIARRQPTAKDLRFIMAMIKTVTDLERMGDEAERIAQMAVRLGPSREPQRLFPELRQLSHHVQQMLGDALHALERLDTQAAAAVVRQDLTVDQEYEGLLRRLMTHMMEDPRSIPRALNVLWAARSLERIGDRARNICEYIIYLVKGKDVRHTSLEDLEREASDSA
jgi:phosphate transport system protein